MHPIEGQIAVRIEFEADGTPQPHVIVPYGNWPFDGEIVGAENDDIYFRGSRQSTSTVSMGAAAPTSATCRSITPRRGYSKGSPAKIVRYEGRTRVPIGKVPGDVVLMEQIGRPSAPVPSFSATATAIVSAWTSSPTCPS